jgi:predicted dehydrogenase
MLRIALVGCGIISEFHIRAYQQHSGRARITVCCDVDPARAAQRAALVGDARAVSDFDAVLADPQVDAIELCTPHHLHPEAVIAAARAGKHVLCQKPLAKTIADCDAMIAAAQGAGVTLFYGEISRTLPAVAVARDAVAAGRIGRPVGVQASLALWQGGQYLSTSWRYDPALTGGGQLLDSGIHALDLMLSIGGSIAAVSALATNVRPELGGEDTSALIARFADGHIGTLFSTQAAGLAAPQSGFTFYGTEGSLTLDRLGSALVLHPRGGEAQREVLAEPCRDVFAAMVGSYLDTVLEGEPSVSPGSVGRENLRIVLAAYESVRTGREVRLDEIAPALLA